MSMSLMLWDIQLPSVDTLILWKRTFSRLSPQSGNLQKMWNSQLKQLTREESFTQVLYPLSKLKQRQTFGLQILSLMEKIFSDWVRSLEIFNRCGNHNIGIHPGNNHTSKFPNRYSSNISFKTIGYLRFTTSFSDREDFFGLRLQSGYLQKMWKSQ